MQNLLRVAAIASLLSALTTAVLIYGPNLQTGSNPIAQAELHNNWGYLYKPWVLFIHPQFAFIASLGAAVVLFEKNPALVSIGLFYLLLWAVTEITQQAYIIDGLNQFWRPAYLNADTETQKQTYDTIITGFKGTYDSMYFVLLFGFGIGTTLFGLAFLSATLFEKTIGATFIFIGSLSLAAFASYYAGLSVVSPVSSWIYANVYGVIQTGVRLALGYWLWREANKGSS